PVSAVMFLRLRHLRYYAPSFHRHRVNARPPLGFGHSRLISEPLEERQLMAVVAELPFFPDPSAALLGERLIVPGDDPSDIAVDTRTRPDHLTVKFYQTLDVTGGATGLHSASNPANWQLLSGDADVSYLIANIEVAGDTATLHLQGPLSAGT